MRESRWIWLALVVMAVGFAVWSALAGDVAGRFLAAMAGVLVGVGLMMWMLGGHISAFSWWLGAEGERDTARRIEQLGLEWHCEHDLEYDRGNFDHVLIGPPGVFRLDSKLLHGSARAEREGLRSGRVAYDGKSFRGGGSPILNGPQRAALVAALRQVREAHGL